MLEEVLIVKQQRHLKRKVHSLVSVFVSFTSNMNKSSLLKHSVHM